MTKNATAATRAEQRREELIERLREVAAEMATNKAEGIRLTERRRQLLIEAYHAGIDTVQLGRIIGTSSETVRKNLEQLGGLRNTGPTHPKQEG